MAAGGRGAGHVISWTCLEWKNHFLHESVHVARVNN